MNQLKQIQATLFSILLLGSFWGCKKNVAPEVAFEPNPFVDPFIGTGAHGHVYPGATTPFGMVQLSPDNGKSGWDWCSGYNWEDSLIVGFSHLHLSGTGIGDLLDISVMPTLDVQDLSVQEEPRASSYAATFSHDKEWASPGYYKVELDNGIIAELTASTRVGVHRYQFPEGAPAQILLDLGFAVNWDRPVETMLQKISDTRLVGYRFSTGWAKDQKVYFAMDFSAPFQLSIADTTAVQEIGDEAISGQKLRALFSFDNQSEIVLKTGLSTASTEGAIAALEETKGRSFEQLRQAAAAAWTQELSKIQAYSKDTTVLTTFYTALYHTALVPNVLSDAVGAYKGAGGALNQARGYTRYSLFSLWDTFRAANPLYTITQADKINDFIRSFLAHYDEYGLLPVWDLHANETNTMTGYHAVPVIADAYLKGFRGFDAEKAFVAMKKSSMQDIRGTNFYREYGYIPHDKTGQSVTRTLEYAYDDWCIAQMAKALGHQEDYQKYMERSQAFTYLFDDSTGFMRAKMANGDWKAPFDPYYSSHDFAVAEYTEGNAFQHSWFVPHAIDELIALHGGKAGFIQKLDELFTASSKITGDFVSADISGLIGQYAHGNEPSHHIAYLYNYADAPEKTQSQVRNIMKTQYNDTPYGLCGNEDCGQMSAWYVFSAMGMYPVNPASGRYDFGSPILDEVTIPLDNGKTFTIIAHNNSAENKYIERIQLNGKAYQQHFIEHQDIVNGGRLEFFMTAAPTE